MAGIPGVSDLIQVVKTQTEALASLPMTLVNLTQALRSLTDVVSKAGETVGAVNRVVMRADSLLAELEQPMRDLAPGMTKVAVIINDPVIDEIPTTLAALNRDILPIMRAMAETQAKVAGIAATTDRMMGLLDDVQERLSHLPGANLLSRRAQQRRTAAPLASATATGEGDPEVSPS